MLTTQHGEIANEATSEDDTMKLGPLTNIVASTTQKVATESIKHVETAANETLATDEPIPEMTLGLISACSHTTITYPTPTEGIIITDTERPLALMATGK